MCGGVRCNITVAEAAERVGAMWRFANEEKSNEKYQQESPRHE
jgi:hypothetical protein